MSNEYYERKPIEHLDGTPIFQNAADRAAEERIADRLASAWGCEIKPFGALCQIDWYAVRDGRMVGILELKTRKHPSTQYPTVLLNCRKWLALTMGAMGWDCPALFVVELTDGLFWVPLTEINASRHRVMGCLTIVKSHNDIEPIILIPTDKLRRIV